MKYYLIAGEASGDLHASNLMKGLKKVDSAAEFRFWGGDKMQSVGGELIKHYRELAFMGFAEVVMNLRTILKNLAFCKKDIKAWNPDAIIFVDYPGFNLKIAKWAKKEGYSTHYYISPQVWAWKENRVNSIKRDVDHLYVILPFEKEFYENKHAYKVHFTGHPLIDAIAQQPKPDLDTFLKFNNLDERPIIALLPGSRKQEISKMLRTMLKTASDFPDYQFVIAAAPSIDREFYEQFTQRKNVFLVTGQTYDLLALSTAALVTSGTATLETALFKVPQVVCYKGGFVSYQIAKRIIKLDYISLVNLIMEKEVVTELIQNKFNPKNLKKELQKILDPTTRERIFEDYFKLEQKLGGEGASLKTAELIYQNTLQK
ncbi:MAG TPA: lipid-A-disaccharide synthase [Flavobacteriaceae bacterium]|nr:lipid-A-disaccharide synthase [Flavobacteriaceae bacterium]